MADAETLEALKGLSEEQLDALMRRMGRERDLRQDGSPHKKAEEDLLHKSRTQRAGRFLKDVTRNKKILESGEYSDFTITCRGEVFKVHKVFICPQSRFFAAVVGAGFKESTSAKLDLPDDDQKAVKRLLTYLYTAQYDDEDVPSSTFAPSMPAFGPPDMLGHMWPTETYKSDAALLNNTDVFLLADKYGVDDLKLQAGVKVCSQLYLNRPGAVAEVLKRLFTSMPDAAKDEIVQVILGKCIRNVAVVPREAFGKRLGIKAMLKEALENPVGPFLESADYKALVEQHPEIGAAVEELAAKSPIPQPKRRKASMSRYANQALGYESDNEDFGSEDDMESFGLED